MAKITYIAVVSVPMFSHQASMVEFCKRLISLHQHIHVTCIFPTIGTPTPAITTLLESLPSTINHTFLTPVKEEDLPQGVPLFEQVQHAVTQSMPSFRNVLRSLCSTSPLSALVVDAFANEAFELVREFNLLAYIYLPSSAMGLSTLMHFPSLNDQVLCDFKDHTEALKIPGCIPMQGHDFPSDLHERSNLSYKIFLECCKRFSLADGFLVNSFSEMEQGTVKALKEHYRGSNKASIYLVGPIIQTGPSSESKNMSECVRWLEKQRPNSVLYVSFGSGGTLPQKQLDELALGLELSGQKFLWVLRPPNDSTEGAYIVAAKDDPLQFLPAGFLERTKEQGLVVPFWAPQTQILSHTSTGGFLTHCGWNSTLESIMLGVPMVTWPLFAEQRMNAVLLTEGLHVALRPKFNEKGVVEREEIAQVIKGLMLGEKGNEIRQRIEMLKDAGVDALKEDGSSTRALSQVAIRMENFQGHA
ncbi:hypothetical protein VNO77_20189 [Canavalia gladiata]|uniref:Glycosyltransferase n=1 Tax=Canavalia gladiata TaxID=3824 RepID=A0AAN9LT02_CANGL